MPLDILWKQPCLATPGDYSKRLPRTTTPHLEVHGTNIWTHTNPLYKPPTRSYRVFPIISHVLKPQALNPINVIPGGIVAWVISSVIRSPLSR